MRETLTIKDFGPISGVVLDDIRPMTVFIGESGSGKSTIMKVLALMRWLYKMMSIRSYLKYSGVRKSPFRFSIDRLLKISGLNSYMHADTIIEYSYGSVRICIENGTLKGTSTYVPEEELSLEKISYVAENRNVIPDMVENKIVSKDQFYLDGTYDDYMRAAGKIKSFDADYLGVRLEVRKTPQGVKHVIVPMNGKSYDIRLNEASSGTKNVMPLNMIVKYYSTAYDIVESMNQAIISYVARADALKDFSAVENVGSLRHKRVHLFIEEPELSLFPDSQVHLMDYIVGSVFDQARSLYGMSLMIATHSPYIVNYLNVLISDGGKLSPESLAVYRVYDGGIQNLMMALPDGRIRVNTEDLSETMEYIYENYARFNS